MSPSTVPHVHAPATYTPQETLLAQEYQPILETIHAFGGRIGETIRANPGIADLHRVGESVHRLFQKWNLEILYLLALRDGLRFNELLRALPGISTRTLSQKLGDLEGASYVVRTVSEEKPLRVDYALSPIGRTLARLTVPLVMFLRFKDDGAVATS